MRWVNEMRMDGIKEESGIFPDIPAGISGRDQSVSGATGQEDRDCSGICGDRSTGRAACQERGPWPGYAGTGVPEPVFPGNTSRRYP